LSDFVVALIRALKDFAGRIENAVKHKPEKSNAAKPVGPGSPSMARRTPGRCGPRTDGELSNIAGNSDVRPIGPDRRVTGILLAIARFAMLNRHNDWKQESLDVSNHIIERLTLQAALPYEGRSLRSFDGAS
jgi:hypothetical protein